MEEEEECCVCFHPTRNFVTPCCHTICKSCFIKWSAKEIFCPICKAIVVSPCPVDEISDSNRDVTCFPTEERRLLGITLCNSDDGEGVKVKMLSSDSLASDCGLKKRVIITHINDIPFSDHRKAITLIDRAQVHLHVLKFRVKETEVSPLHVEELKEGGWSPVSALKRCLRQ